MNTATQTQTRPAPAKTPRVEYLTPLANILETTDGYLLEVEMAGVTKAGVEVLVENGELTLIGRRGEVETKGREIFRESRRLDYRRVFELDPSIDLEHVTARIDQGVLKVHLPKSENVKPRKIEIA